MQHKTPGESLEDFLGRKVFVSAREDTLKPDAADRAGVLQFLDRYVKGLDIQKAAVRQLR
jgi:hypothetical protein